jgi:[acyl-carrier-protein] S-malonyltransferase
MGKVLSKQFPELTPTVCAGLSLGEYTAITYSGRMLFQHALSLVQNRGQFMNEACQKHHGTMAVILGLSAEEVEKMVKELALTNDLWAANFNSPGQVVISGTFKGVEIGSAEAKKRGAKRVLPLQVSGAFHSGLMKDAEKKLEEHIHTTPLVDSKIELVMNVPGNTVKELSEIRKYMIMQVTHSVRWEQSIRAMESKPIDLYLEIGCGKTLSGLNKRNNVIAPTFNIEKVEDLTVFEQWMAKNGAAS